MIEKIINFSAAHKLAVLTVIGAACIAGWWRVLRRMRFSKSQRDLWQSRLLRSNYAALLTAINGPKSTPMQANGDTNRYGAMQFLVPVKGINLHGE